MTSIPWNLIMSTSQAEIFWLDGSPPPFTPSGTSFGIPWNEGQIDRTTALKVQASGSSASIPVQTWPLA